MIPGIQVGGPYRYDRKRDVQLLGACCSCVFRVILCRKCNVVPNYKSSCVYTDQVKYFQSPYMLGKARKTATSREGGSSICRTGAHGNALCLPRTPGCALVACKYTLSLLSLVGWLPWLPWVPPCITFVISQCPG